MFRGGSQLPSNSASVLVSTPEAYLALAKRSNSQFDLGTFALVIFDEVHHVSKDHPYSRVAKKLTNLAGSGQGHPIQARMCVRFRRSYLYCSLSGKVIFACEYLPDTTTSHQKHSHTAGQAYDGFPYAHFNTFRLAPLHTTIAGCHFQAAYHV